MVHMIEHEKWLTDTTGGASRRQVAAAIQLPQSTFNRQANAGEFDAETVIAVARAYSQNPVAALIQTGYLNDTEAGMTASDALRLLTDQQLVRELARRVDNDDAAWAGTFDEVIEAKVEGLPSQPVRLPRVDFAYPPDDQDNYEMAARDLGDEPVGRKLRRAQDEASELPDEDGPEGGA